MACENEQEDTHRKWKEIEITETRQEKEPIKKIVYKDNKNASFQLFSTHIQHKRKID